MKPIRVIRNLLQAHLVCVNRKTKCLDGSFFHSAYFAVPRGLLFLNPESGCIFSYNTPMAYG
jgi:hypothetical protein